MVPKVAAKGTSFKGAGLYYLHDKQARTTERVAFTHTEGLATNDPELALKMMAHTAINQNRIKDANGAARTGRKLTYPVYTYSLSWATDEQPSQEQMIEAGQQTLKELGLDGHEVLMVAHNDEPHPHIHLIVNRVHPQTGIAAALSNDHLKLSRWAEAYERKHGKIRCEQRVINNEARRQGQFVKDRRSLRPMHLPSVAAAAWQGRVLRPPDYGKKSRRLPCRAASGATRPACRTARRSLRSKGGTHQAVPGGAPEAKPPKWAELYRQQRQEKRDLNAAQRTAYSRLRYYLEAPWPRSAPSHHFGAAKDRGRSRARGARRRQSARRLSSRKHEAERAALAKEGRALIMDQIQEINERYREDLKQLRQAQTAERQKFEQGQKRDERALEAEHTRQSQQRARDIKEGRDRQQFREEVGKDVSDEFARRVRNSWTR
jgi:hypothetical protein